MARNRMPSQFGEFVKFVDTIVQRLDAADRKSPELREIHAALEKSLDALVKVDRRQETLKAQLGKATSELEADHRNAKSLIARLVSWLEYAYGKSSPELLKYGITPRRFGAGRKGQASASGSAAQ